MIDVEQDFENASPGGEIRHGVRQLGRDAVTLAELQADLLKVELRDWVQTSAAPAATLAAVTAVIGLASLPVTMLGLAHYLADAAGRSIAAAMLAVGGGGIALAAVFGIVAWRRALRTTSAFTRFRSELTQNIRWLKHVLGRGAATGDSNPFDHNHLDQDHLEPGRVRPR